MLGPLQPPPSEVTLLELVVHSRVIEDVNKKTQGAHSRLQVDVTLQKEHQPVEA